MPKLRDNLKIKLIFRPFRTKGRKRPIGFYQDESRSRKVIEIDSRENIPDMIKTIFHEFTHLVLSYFALDPQCVEKIKEAMNGNQYSFKKITEDEEDNICDDIGEKIRDYFRKHLEK